MVSVFGLITGLEVVCCWTELWLLQFLLACQNVEFAGFDSTDLETDCCVLLDSWKWLLNVFVIWLQVWLFFMPLTVWKNVAGLSVLCRFCVFVVVGTVVTVVACLKLV